MKKNMISNLSSKQVLRRSQTGDLAPIQALKQQNPAFHWSELKHETGDTILHISARLGHVSNIKYLLSYEPPSTDCTNNDDKTPLHEAAQFSQLEALKLLIENGACINALKRGDWTPLMLACTKRNLEIVKTLIKHGTFINYRNKDGWTCLHLAAREGCTEIFQYLLGNGADCKAMTKNGRTVLHIGALHGNLNILKSCDVLDLNVRDNCGNTPLHEAILGNNIAICRFLIKKGAQISCKNSVDFGLLHLAGSEGYNDCISFLVEELQCDVNEYNANGWTALHCTARKGHQETYQFLVNLGCDEGKVDKFGRLAKHYFTLFNNTLFINVN